MDITSVLQGLTFTLPNLYQQISNNGWEVESVKFDTTADHFIAKAKASHGEKLEAWGPNQQQAVSNLLLNIVHRNGMRSSKLSMWTHTFTDQLAAIAEAYAKAPFYEPKGATAFMELGRDAVMRSKALTEHLEIILVDNPDPYTNAQKMAEDVRKRRKLEVSRAGIEHPIWSEEQMIAFRISFDVLGFCAAGSDFSWEGTNQAFAHYAPMVPAEAQKALFSEVISQTAYATYYRAYGPQKIALFPRFMDPAQGKENPHDGYRGVHPSQALAPIESPAAKSIAHTAAAKPWPTLEDGSPGVDVNAGWQSPYQNNPVLSPTDYNVDQSLGLNEVGDHAANLNTGWADALHGSGVDVMQEWKQYQQKDPQGATRIKQAVSNAIRAACLSPRTKLHHNAIQYQALNNVPYDSTDPNEYWNALEDNRQDWNVTRFGEGARYDHRPWYVRPGKDATGRQDLSPYEKLALVVHQHDPTQGMDKAREVANSEIHKARITFQHELEGNILKGNKPEEEEMWILDRKVNDMVMRWIEQMTKASDPEKDIYQPSQDEQLSLVSATKPITTVHPFGGSYEGSDNHKIFNQQRYGAWFDSAVQAITTLTKNLDGIVEAALWDVHAKDGSGHHFRAYVMSLDASFIGPKVVSFMWLLLQPLTSQLATIDVWMARILKSEDVLGDKGDAVPNRDYFRLERELAARRDAMGLQHKPLGQFQWAVWDLGRTGARPQGTQLALGDQTPPSYLHQDHSAMRVLDPTKPHETYWIPPPPRSNKVPRFDFMSLTDPAAEDVRQQWKDQEGSRFQSTDEFPYQQSWPTRYSKVASSSAVPWFIHPDTQEQIPGKPGQTLMSHLLTSGYDLAGAWGLGDDAVGKLTDPPHSGTI